jgi:hypothetical protein
MPLRTRKNIAIAAVKAYISVVFDQTQDSQTRYAVDAIDGD